MKTLCYKLYIYFFENLCTEIIFKWCMINVCIFIFFVRFFWLKKSCIRHYSNKNQLSICYRKLLHCKQWQQQEQKCVKNVALILKNILYSFHLSSFKKSIWFSFCIKNTEKIFLIKIKIKYKSTNHTSLITQNQLSIRYRKPLQYKTNKKKVLKL